jgi:hypothetical protein
MTHFPKLLLLLFVVTVLTVGCSDTKPAEQPKTAAQETKPAEEVRTVEWWQQPENEATLEAKFEECRHFIYEQQSIDCKVAVHAYMTRRTIEEIREPTFRGFSVEPPDSK